MTDNEFIEELVARLNLFLEADGDRAMAVFTTPMVHAGYANVGHFMGQIAFPRSATPDATAEDLRDVKFLTPVIEDGRITSFIAQTGLELQQKAQDAQKAEADKEPEIH